MEVKNNILYQNDKPVTYKATPNVGKVYVPKYLIIHYDASKNAHGAIEWMTSKVSKVSTHLHIDRDGNIAQLAPLNVVCWHAGKSEWNGLQFLNNYSIGVELQNDGHQDYTVKQLDVVRTVTATLVKHYNLLDVLGHSDISPGRKIDPGVKFPMAKIKDGLFNCDQLSTTSDVNLRAGAGTNFSSLSVIKKGTLVDVIERGNLWYRVQVINTSLYGYIANVYLTK